MGTLVEAAWSATPTHIIRLPQNNAARRPKRSERKGVAGKATIFPMNWAELRTPTSHELTEAVKASRHIPNVFPLGLWK